MKQYRLKKMVLAGEMIQQIEEERVTFLDATNFDIRKQGSFENKAVWLDNPPNGYEWILGKDENDTIIVFQRRKEMHETPKTPSHL